MHLASYNELYASRQLISSKDFKNNVKPPEQVWGRQTGGGTLLHKDITHYI